MKFVIEAAAIVLISILPPCVSKAAVDSFSVFFRSGVWKLDAGQTAQLDSLLYSGSLPGTVSMKIVGYADEPGGTELNRTIAGRRAESVKEYLLATGVGEGRIIQCQGMGNTLHSGDDIGQRRVDIVCIKPGTEQAAIAGLKTSTKIDSATVPVKRKKSLRDLGSMKEDELLVIENLLFKVSTAVIDTQSIPILDELVEILKDFPRLKIRIEGHICCASKSKETDKLKLGYRLSADRAEAVKEYLVAHQIASSRLSYAGFGFSRPKVYPEVTQEDMSLNRRVEIRVISK